MSRLRFGRGAAMVELDDGISRKVHRFLREAMPATMEHLETEIDRIGARAYAQWPVKTGLSKASLDWGVRLSSFTRVDAFIRNDAEKNGEPYGYMIPRGERRRGTWWSHLVGREMRKLQKKLPDDMVEELAVIFDGA